ncbi:MAG: hypothetical protein EXR71_02370 [Myxococcales bacterium]|nr:hypothetical protein [Myxococcales bacterium]
MTDAHRWLGRVAWLLPAMLVGLSVHALVATTPREPTYKQVMVKAALAKASDVIILGNSTAGTDIDPGVVAEAVGMAGSPTVLHVDGSSAPGWLAALDGGVYGDGYRPRLVLIVGVLEWIVESGFARSTQRLDAEAFAADGYIASSVLFGGDAGPVGRARSRGAALHTAFREGVRDVSVGAVFGGEGGVWAAGHAAVVPAVARVFSAPRTVGQLPVHMLNVVEEEEEGVAALAPELQVVRALVDLAHDHGAHIIFVRLPDRPSQPATGPARALEPALLDVLNGMGAGFIDLGGLSLGQDGFADGLHMNRVGRVELNERLGPALARMNPLYSERLSPANGGFTAGKAVRLGGVPALDATVTAGASPCRFVLRPVRLDFLAEAALRARGLGRASPLRVTDGGELLSLRAQNRAQLDAECAGAWLPTGAGLEIATAGAGSTDRLGLALDPSLPLNEGGGDEAWWVYPGTRVELPVRGAGLGTLSVKLRALGGGTPVVRVGDRPVTLVVAGEDVDGEVELEGLSEAWTLVVESPVGGPWTLIEAVEVVAGDDKRVVLGELAPAVRIGNRNWTFESAPPPLPAAAWAADGEGRWSMPLPSLAFLGSDGPRGVGFEGCSPVRVEVEGKLASAHPRGLGKARGGPAAATFRQGTLSLSLAQAPGRTVRALLDAGRRCHGALWLYPGDTVRTRDEKPGLGTLRHGATTVRVRLRVLGEVADADVVEVSVRNGSGAFIDATVPLSEVGEGIVDLPLDRPVVDGAGALTSRFTSRSERAFVLVERVELIEAGAGAALTLSAGASAR